MIPYGALIILIIYLLSIQNKQPNIQRNIGLEEIISMQRYSCIAIAVLLAFTIIGFIPYFESDLSSQQSELIKGAIADRITIFGGGEILFSKADDYSLVIVSTGIWITLFIAIYSSLIGRGRFKVKRKAVDDTSFSFSNTKVNTYTDHSAYQQPIVRHGCINNIRGIIGRLFMAFAFFVGFVALFAFGYGIFKVFVLISSGNLTLADLFYSVLFPIFALIGIPFGKGAYYFGRHLTRPSSREYV